jgi:hypothetical protein
VLHQTLASLSQRIIMLSRVAADPDSGSPF